MAMIPDGFNEDGSFRFRFSENPNGIPDLPFRPYPITTEDIQKLRSALLPPSLDEQLCCASNTNDTEKVKKIKKLVKRCVNLNVYIDGENIFKKILEICESKDEK